MLMTEFGQHWAWFCMLLTDMTYSSSVLRSLFAEINPAYATLNLVLRAHLI
jgi:hypothetical protein